MSHEDGERVVIVIPMEVDDEREPSLPVPIGMAQRDEDELEEDEQQLIANRLLLEALRAQHSPASQYQLDGEGDVVMQPPQDEGEDETHPQQRHCNAQGCRRGGANEALPLKQCVVCDQVFHNPVCGGPRLAQDRECCEACFLEGRYNFDFCSICETGDEEERLLKCESCRNRCHPTCVGLKKNTMLDPLDSFSCDRCACQKCSGPGSHVGVTSSCIACRNNFHQNCVPRGTRVLDEAEGFIRCGKCAQSPIDLQDDGRKRSKRSYGDDDEDGFEEPDEEEEEEEEEEEYREATQKRRKGFKLDLCAHCNRGVPEGSPECDSCFLPFHRKLKCGAPLSMPDELRYCQSCWISGNCHHDKCSICKKKKGGPLLMCDRCANSTHIECINEADKSQIDQAWTCDECECAVCHSGINVECVCTTCKRGFHSGCLSIDLKGLIECSDCLIAGERQPSKLLGWRFQEGTQVKEVYCALKGRSYIHCIWIEDEWLRNHVKQMHTFFWKKKPKPVQDEKDLVLIDYITVGRIISFTGGKYHIKWAGLYYDELTYEFPQDVEHLPGFKEELERLEKRKLFKSVRNQHAVPRTLADFKKMEGTPDYVGGQLYPHQIAGVNFLVSNWYAKRNCILADEMGLGKTCQSLVLLATLRELHSAGPFLVVVPMSTMRNWEREAHNFAPNLDVVMLYGNEDSRKNMWHYDGDKLCMVITTYDVARRDSSTLLNKKWAALIVDEGHSLKNNKAMLYHSMENMKADYRVLLTGTPVQNRVAELVSLLQFLQVEEVHGQDEETVDKMYSLASLQEDGKLEQLHQLVRPYVLRRVKEDVDLGIPKRVEVIVPVSLTETQVEHYKYALKSNYGVLVERKSLKKGFATNLLMSLRHICNHPYLILEEEPQFESIEQEYETLIAASAKVALLDRMLQKLTTAGHRVLIFSQFVRVLDLLDDYMNYRNYKYERIDGGTSLEDRQLAIDRFNRPQSNRQVFLLSTKATSLGINLASADTVIMFDSDWNPQNDLQAIHRAHRLGQKNIVLLLVLMTANSAEEKLLSRARSKRVLEHLVIGKLNKKLDKDELSRTIAYGADNIISGRVEQIVYTDADLEELLDRDAQLALQEEEEAKQAGTKTTSAFSFSKVWDGAVAIEDDKDQPPVRSDTFWKDILGDVEEEVKRQNTLVLKTKRKRRTVRYFGEHDGEAEFIPEQEKEEEAFQQPEVSESSDEISDEPELVKVVKTQMEVLEVPPSKNCPVCFGIRGHKNPCVSFHKDPFLLLHVSETRILKIPYTAAWSLARAIMNDEIKVQFKMTHPIDDRVVAAEDVVALVEKWMIERTAINMDRPSNTGANCFAVCAGQQIPRNIERMLIAIWKENPCKDERFQLLHPKSLQALPVRPIAEFKKDGVELVKKPTRSMQDLIKLAGPNASSCKAAFAALGQNKQ